MISGDSSEPEEEDEDKEGENEEGKGEEKKEYTQDHKESSSDDDNGTESSLGEDEPSETIDQSMISVNRRTPEPLIIDSDMKFIPNGSIYVNFVPLMLNPYSLLVPMSLGLIVANVFVFPYTASFEVFLDRAYSSSLELTLKMICFLLGAIFFKRLLSFCESLRKTGETITALSPPSKREASEKK